MAFEQDYRACVVRGAVGVTLLLLSLPVGGYGLLYLGAIWTSDTSTGSLVMVGSLLLEIAAGSSRPASSCSAALHPERLAVRESLTRGA